MIQTVLDTVLSYLSEIVSVKRSVSLAELSTMRVGGTAAALIEVDSISALQQVFLQLETNRIPYYIIGDGSNTLFLEDYNGVIIKVAFQGRTLVAEDETSCTYAVAAGENWHDFVAFCADQNLTGLENLALIPGTVGAAPVQNIAAYGQAQEDAFVAAKVLDIATGEITMVSKNDCTFSYRSSRFKTDWRGKYCIVEVQYRLEKALHYKPETSYHSRFESLADFMPESVKNKERAATVRDVFDAIVAVRKHKLPQVDEVGTLGSFFMNPFVTMEQLKHIQQKFPTIQYYPVEKMQYPNQDQVQNQAEKQTNQPRLQNLVKIPAGWLIDELGFRGTFVGNVGSSPKQALCIVVTGPATGREVQAFARMIKQRVLEETGVEIHAEVNVLDQTGFSSI